MNRNILRFQRDDQEDWYAVLSCGHRQHVRHQPPFQNRAWVTTPEGRESRIGEMLNCPSCDQRTLPEGFVPFHQTPVFTENSVPAGLQKDHSTKPGVWAKIEVESGSLRYHLDGLGETIDLLAGQTGIVLPEIVHHVEPLGSVRFFVEFWHAPDSV